MFSLSSPGQVLSIHQSFEQHDIIKIQSDAKLQILNTNIYKVHKNGKEIFRFFNVIFGNEKENLD